MASINSTNIQMHTPAQSQVEAERTRENICYIPRTDIYENDDQIILFMEMPGIDKNAINITLENNILTVSGYRQINHQENYSLVHAEYRAGDYERSFRLSNMIDKDAIEAIYQNGVLKLVLPKVDTAKTRKIAIKTLA